MPKIRPLHDGVVVKLDPLSEERVSKGGIILVDVEFIRTGVAIVVGPGNRFVDRYVKMDLKVGQRVCFFAGAMDTKQGQAMRARLNEDEALIRETDVLFTIEGDDFQGKITK